MDISKFKDLMCFYGEKIDIVFSDEQLNQF